MFPDAGNNQIEKKKLDRPTTIKAKKKNVQQTKSRASTEKLKGIINYWTMKKNRLEKFIG